MLSVLHTPLPRQKHFCEMASFMRSSFLFQFLFPFLGWNELSSLTSWLELDNLKLRPKNDDQSLIPRMSNPEIKQDKG